MLGTATNNLFAVYLQLLPTELLVISVFGLFYILVAAVARHFLGVRAVWVWLALCVPALTISCIYKLSGIARDAPSAGARMFYLACVALAIVGIPLWYAARGLLWLDSRTPRPTPVIQIAGAWAISLAASPLAIIAVFAIDAVASNFGFGGFAH